MPLQRAHPHTPDFHTPNIQLIHKSHVEKPRLFPTVATRDQQDNMQSPAQNENVGQVENLLRVLEARHAATQEQSLNALSRQGHSTRTNTGWLVHFKRVLVRCSFEHRLSYKEAHFIPPLPCLRLLAFYSIGNRIQSLLLSPTEGPT